MARYKKYDTQNTDNEIYNTDYIGELIDNDMVSSEEAGFMHGYLNA